MRAWHGIVAVLVAASMTQATTTWTGGAANGDWFDSGNWDSGTPGTGAEAVIGGDAAVLLTNSTAHLASLTLNTCTLTCSNWTTKLSADNVVLHTGAQITLPGAFTTSEMSNRVWIACSNLLVDTGASITANGAGYDGGINPQTVGFGPGRGWSARAGGGYGGFGGGGQPANYSVVGGTTYGSAAAPDEPGSGGARGSVNGGAGGGVVRIQAQGAVIVNGAIRADGENPGHYAGGGSGGAIHIKCLTFGGTNGTLQARGGNTSQINVGVGGGGRIAVHYDAAAQMNVPQPTVDFSVRPGVYVSGTTLWPGGMGTLDFTDASLLSETLTSNLEGYISGFPAWHVARLTVDNCWVGFAEEGFQLTVTNDVLVTGSACNFQLGGTVYEPVSTLFYHDKAVGPELSVGGALTVSNGAAFSVCAGLTGPQNYGALVSVTGDVALISQATLYLCSHPTNGASVLLDVTNVFVGGGCSISAAGRGYSGGPYQIFSVAGDGCQPGFGPGGGPSIGYDHGGGGGHGGKGGDAGMYAFEPGGTPYGSVSAPLDPGSGGGGGANWGAGGNGGGLIQVQASGDVTVNGTLDASGGLGHSSYGGGGAGGGIFVTCRTLAGQNGVLQADGANGKLASGGGGGGRIAVIYDTSAQSAAPLPQLTFSANRGAGGNPTWLATNDRDHYLGNSDGELGTIYFPDNRLLKETISDSGIWSVPGFTNWAPHSLTLNNGTIRFPADGFHLSVTGDVRVSGSEGALQLCNAELNCGGNLTITNGSLVMYGSATTQPRITVGGDVNIVGTSPTTPGTIYIYAGETNAALDYGARMTVTGAMNLISNAWVYPISHPTAGGAPLFHVRTLAVGATNAGFNANAKGYERVGNGVTTDNGLGPGHGYYSPGKVRPSGAGYGGRGGRSELQANVGATYGVTNAPLLPGSSGGSGGGVFGRIAARGGGLIRIEACEAVTLDGTLTANSGVAGAYGGGGSGGGILVTCDTFTGGPSAVMQAKGGDSGHLGVCGGGGGGRIAVWYGAVRDSDRAHLLAGNDDAIVSPVLVSPTLASYQGSLSVVNGAGYPTDPAQYSQPGTVVFLTIHYPPAGTIILIQ